MRQPTYGTAVLNQPYAGVGETAPGTFETPGLEERPSSQRQRVSEADVDALMRQVPEFRPETYRQSNEE